MHIVFQHDKVLPVPRYGGIERLIVWLMKDLVKLGHTVTLLGHPDSHLAEFGIKVIPANSDEWRSLIPEDADIVHLFYPYLHDLPVPHICYIAGNAQPNEDLPLNSVFSSQSHASNHGSKCFVHHGIDYDDYPLPLPPKSETWNRFSFLAKASWKIKNLKSCIKATQKAKAHLYIGGGWKFTFNPRIHWMGLLTDSESCTLYDKTDAFLWPVLWPEPFGLAPIVAMSRGLPVLASVHGSSPELIKDSGVGTLCRDYNEFSEAIRHKGNFYKASQIRDYALSTFPVRKMTEAFLMKYEFVIAGNILNPQKPKAQFTKAADKVLLSF